jgi:hypothetical protein
MIKESNAKHFPYNDNGKLCRACPSQWQKESCPNHVPYDDQVAQSKVKQSTYPTLATESCDKLFSYYNRAVMGKG